MLLNRRWKNKINWTDYISERVIATSVSINNSFDLLICVFFPHSIFADRHVEKAHRATEKYTKSKIAGGESVLDRIHSKRETRVGNKRGDWIKQWVKF